MNGMCFALRFEGLHNNMVCTMHNVNNKIFVTYNICGWLYSLLSPYYKAPCVTDKLLAWSDALNDLWYESHKLGVR